MKATRLLAGLTPRIVLIAALCAFFGMGLTYLVLTQSVASRVFALGGEIIAEVMRVRGGLGCDAAPANWGGPLRDGSQVHAYDVATFTSANPASPPLDAARIAEIRAGAERVMPGPFFVGQEAVLLVRVAESGPCSLVRFEWRGDPGLRREALLILAGFLLLALVVTVVLGMLWVVRPLLRRVAVTAAAAGAVGDEENFPGEHTAHRDELGDIERGLQAAHERIAADRAALQAKTAALRRHLADLAHDLLTPISSLQLALERLASGDGAEAEEALAAALADAVYLENLTDNLRLAAKIEEGLVADGAPQRTDLVAVVERVTSRLRPLARHRQLQLDDAHPDGPVWAAGDPVLAERALSNLVHNAIRYGEPDGHVAVLLEADAGAFSLEVIDDGPGVPPAEIERLSERSFRGDAARGREVQGQGLGLAITAELCARVGFELGFKAVQPRGLRAIIGGPRLDTASAADEMRAGEDNGQDH